jgi:twitching motility protein PilI
LYSGLVVDTALGMQHFPIETYSKTVNEMDDGLRPFIKGSYAQSRGGLTAPDQRWYVFSPALLAEEPRFVNAAQ